MITIVNKIILRGALVGLVSTIIAAFYVLFYFYQIVDFSEGKGITSWLPFLTSCYLLISFAIAFLHQLLVEKVIDKRKKRWGALFLMMVLFGLSFGLVIYFMVMDDPFFVTENAQLMMDFYKGFLMPLAFIPALTWYSIQSI